MIGNVRLGQDSSIWFAAVLRGDNELIDLGDGRNIQDGVVCHTDIGEPLTIGRNCTIGHKAVLHGCTIGDGSLVGMGATILNNARIGKSSLVGANALVLEGKVFPNNALIIGAPARAIRALTPRKRSRASRARLRATSRTGSGLREIFVASDKKKRADKAAQFTRYSK